MSLLHEILYLRAFPSAPLSLSIPPLCSVSSLCQRKWAVFCCTDYWIIFWVVIECYSLFVLCFNHIICNVNLPKATFLFFRLRCCKIQSTVRTFKRNVCHRFRDFSCCVVRCAQITHVLAHATLWPWGSSYFLSFYVPWWQCANFSSMDTYKILAARCHIQYLLNLYG